MFEILPPPASWQLEKIASYCLQVTAMIREQQVLSVGIPEVINENRIGERQTVFFPKMDNVPFAEFLQQQCLELEPIIYKISVRIPKKDFEQWVANIFNIGLRHVVLVGGEHRGENYAGYSVIEATQFIKKHFPLIQVGAIAIFTRQGEVQRLLDKMKAGVDFFTTQIIFEAMNMKHILSQLAKVCSTERFPLPKIYVSLTLASRTQDIEFMKWLGVEFPSAVFSYLDGDHFDSVETRSQEIMNMLLDEIFDFLKKVPFPIGFNIEHVTYSNLALSEKLFKNLKQRINQL